MIEHVRRPALLRGHRAHVARGEAIAGRALDRLDPLWDELFPTEQARIMQLLVERVDGSPAGADIRLRTKGLTHFVADLHAVQPELRRAA